MAGLDPAIGLDTMEKGDGPFLPRAPA